ncbi:MAG TPA: hypothetical protein P5118_00050 [Planctomycetota bacterium]|nr:hypothetical protein [Planctomycetota bacterium]
MSTPKPTEGASVRIVPLAIFALLLIIPFLNFEFTLYRSTLKLFVFESTVTLLWGYLLWEWAAGRLGRTGWPAWWLFAPVGLWVAWGAATCVWSHQAWLARGGLVQGVYGAAGAFGLALLLHERENRHMFVAAAGAVAFALAFFMLLYYGDPRAKFLGDVDGLDGREAGAAFLLLPTLAAAAALYHLGKQESEAGYRRVLWTAVLLAVLLLAGLRTRVPAWRYALGAGLVVLVWRMLPRWRLAALALLAVLGLAVAHREVAQRAVALEYLSPLRSARNAVLDRAAWGLLRGASLPRLVAGHGVGAFFLVFDRERPVWTYGVSYGDEVVGHASRQLVEELVERGLVGVAIAVVVGLACMVAGSLVCRRARDGLDAALGAGLAAAVVALGVFACFSNGALGFGSGMMFWVGLGLLGALTVECGRPAGLSWSPEEALARAEARRRLRWSAVAAAGLAGVIGIVAWGALAARPFWAEYCLREGQAENSACQRLLAQKRLGERNLHARRAAVQQMRADLGGKLRAAEKELAAATAAHEEAVKGGGDVAPLLARKEAAAATVEKLRAEAKRAPGQIEATLADLEESLRATTAEYEESAARVTLYLRRAATLSLGDRVWLNAQTERALSDSANGNHQAAAERLEGLEALCGPAFALDVVRAGCYVKLKRPAEAHDLYHRYSHKNPFGALCTLFTPRAPFYEDWFALVADERLKKSPRAASWARDFLASASLGLAWYPDHYGLLLLRGEMLYRFGEKDRARDDMMAAAALIEDALRNISGPLPRATLYFELANANIHWDKAKAVKAAKQVFLEKVDFRDPQAQQVLFKAQQILRRLDPASLEKPAPPADGTGQAPKTPATP